MILRNVWKWEMICFLSIFLKEFIDCWGFLKILISILVSWLIMDKKILVIFWRNLKVLVSSFDLFFVCLKVLNKFVIVVIIVVIILRIGVLVISDKVLLNLIELFVVFWMVFL